MKVLIDIDDTLSITTPSWTLTTEKYMSFHNYKRTRPPEEDVYDLAISFDIPTEQYTDYYSYMRDNFDFASLQPACGAAEFISYLKKHNHTVEYITARHTTAYSVTKSWIARYLKDFNPIIHYKSFVTDIVADILIDNSERRVRDAISRGMNAVLFDGIKLEMYEPSNLEGLVIANTFEKIEQILENLETA